MSHNVVVIVLRYRGTPDSTSFGSRDNDVIRGIVLNEDWFSTKTCEIDKSIFKVPFFTFFLVKNNVIFFRNQYLIQLNTIRLKYSYWFLKNPSKSRYSTHLTSEFNYCILITKCSITWSCWLQLVLHESYNHFLIR